MGEEKNNIWSDKGWHDITEDEVGKLAPKFRKRLNNKYMPRGVIVGAMFVSIIVNLLEWKDSADEFRRNTYIYCSVGAFLIALLLILVTVIQYKNKYKRFTNGEAKCVAVRVEDKYTDRRAGYDGEIMTVFIIKVTSFTSVALAVPEEMNVDSRTYNEVSKDSAGYIVNFGKDQKSGEKSDYYFFPAFFSDEKEK